MKWFFLLLLCPAILCAQELSLQSSQTLDIDRFIGYDSYQHLYYVNDGDLYKKGDLGEFVFRDFQLGPIASVDIINPLNVVVFYAEVNTVVLLDNRLNEKQRINFNTLPAFLNLSAATNAGNNRLWVFNMETQQLELFNYRTTGQTIISQPYEGSLVAQVSDFNDCLLLTETHLWQINIYGSLLWETPLEGFERIVRSGKNIIGLKENRLYLINDKGVTRLENTFIENPVKDLQLTQDFLYIYDGKELYSIILTQPKQ
ncbi:MAG: hypothetical protein AAF466_00515 [Bacteroidota bacterium]